MRRLLPLLPLMLLGCGRGETVMPLEQGRSWTYRVYNGVLTFVEPVEVKGKVPVGPVEGTVLTGPMGTSHMAWQGDTLYASRMANAGFYPPVPLVVENGGRKTTRSWRGTIDAFGQKRDAYATLTQEPAKVASGGTRYNVTRTLLNLHASEGGQTPTEIEVTTSFRSGVGIVEQVQRTNRDHIVTLKLLD